MHDPQEADFGVSDDLQKESNVDLEEKGTAGSEDSSKTDAAVPAVDAEQEGGKYGVRAIIGGFGITYVPIPATACEFIVAKAEAVLLTASVPGECPVCLITYLFSATPESIIIDSLLSSL